MSSKNYKIRKAAGHSWTTFSKKSGLSAFSYCDGCGLIALKNETTAKAIRKGCVIKEDL